MCAAERRSCHRFLHINYYYYYYYNNLHLDSLVKFWRYINYYLLAHLLN